MERAAHTTKWLSVSGLLVGTIVLTRAIPTSFAFDRPVHSSTAILAGAGSVVVALSRLLPQDAGERVRKARGSLYERLPLTEVGRPHASREPSPMPEDVTHANSQRKLRILFLALVTLICLRVEVLRQVVDNVQCATKHWNYWIPLVFAAWEFWTTTAPRRNGLVVEDEDPDEITWLDKVVVLPYAQVVATLAVAVGGWLALDAVSSPTSTYICAVSFRYWAKIPWIQRLASLIDVGIVFTLDQLLTSKQAKKLLSIANRFALVGAALLVS